MGHLAGVQVVAEWGMSAAFEVADTLEDVDTEEFNFIPPPVTNPARGGPGPPAMVSWS